MGSKKIWVPKDKVIYVADTLNRKMRCQSWCLEIGCSLYIKERRHMFQDLKLKPNGSIDSKEIQESKIIGLESIGTNFLPSFSNIELYT